ncbi:MAG TPA: hypothetical protein VI341_07265 [Actinomycetota bacterium]
MRKSMPFVATALVSVLITAGIMQASAGARVTPSLRATGEPVSRVLGLNLVLKTCDASPRNASEWTKFAKCSTDNFGAIKKWGTKLDKCMAVYQVERRNTFAQFVDGTTTTQTDGLAEYGGTGPFHYVMEWKDQASCPTT